MTARSRSGTRRGTYELPPEISSISAAPIGALVVAEHAEVVRDETLGVSDGTPAQTFQLRHPPVLALGDRERLQSQDGQWTDWSLCESFAESDKDDLHFRLDPTTGEIELGPAIRSVNGVWLQHGAIPPEGKPLRMTAYRHGGGQAGNVAANMLRVLRRAIPGVATVTNPSPAHGGIDAETLEHARRRAAMEHRTRSRAVTAEDYEYLCTAEITHVARAHCVRAKEPGGPVRLHILPHVEPADRWMRAEEFEPNGALLREVEALLDERKPVGANVDVLPAVVRAVTVVADVKIGPHEDVIRLEQDVLQALNVYLNPLIGGGSGTGWEFGRTLNVGELFGVVQAVPGVRYVNLLRMYESDLHTGDIVGEESGAHLALHAGQTLASGQHQVRVSRVKSAT